MKNLQQSRLFALARAVLLSGGALGLSLFYPPYWEWQTVSLPMLGLAVVGLALYLAGIFRKGGRGLAVAGAGLLWLVIAACLLLQPDRLGQPRLVALAPRLLLLAGLLLVWTLLTQRTDWKLRAALAFLLPTLLVLDIVLIATPARPGDFQPNWLALDSQGNLIVSDADGAILRRFNSQGGLLNKLSLQSNATLKAGYVSADPYSDPARLGLVTPGAAVQGKTVVPASDFYTCGVANDRHGHLLAVNVPARSLLQLDETSGQLLNSWPWPRSYAPSSGCLAVDEDYIYLGDPADIQSVFVLKRQDASLVTILNLPIRLSTLAISADGTGQLYVLAAPNQVCRYRLSEGQAPSCWQLPAPANPLQSPYRTIVATPQRIFVSEANQGQILIFSPTGQALGKLGGCGPNPGQTCRPRGMLVDSAGNLLVADAQNAIVQRFSPDFSRVTATWRALEDETDGY